MNFAVDLDGSKGSVRVTGYLSQSAGEQLSKLLRDLGKMGIAEIGLDISLCSPIGVGALERLLEAKFDLACRDVQVIFGRSTPTLAKVFGLMGLRPDGEPLAATGTDGRG